MEEVKKGKKKNKVASLLLALALILTCGVAGTIAQYQKSLGGTATATVAKFDVDAQYKGTSISGQQIDLFKTILDTKNGTTEADVSGTNIAPGTMGYIPVDLSNNSEVTVNYQLYAKWSTDAANKYTIQYTKSDTTTDTQPIPLKFALYTGSSAPTASELTQLVTSNKFTDISSLNMPSSGNGIAGSYGQLGHTTDKKATVYLCWEWEFEDATKSEDRNLLDTAIGEAMKSSSTKLNPIVEVGVKFTQED